MFRITKQVELDAGHRVPSHKGKCRNVHGHRYKVVAELELDDIRKPGQSDDGMVADFGDIKKVMTEYIHDPYDHKLILWQDDPLVKAGLVEFLDSNGGLEVTLVPTVPTAENLAKVWFFTMAMALGVHMIDVRLVNVGVWETPTSYAEYSPLTTRT